MSRSLPRPRPRRLAPRPALLAPRAQVAAELALEPAARLHVERAVDRLVRDPHVFIVGVPAPQPARDLLRRVVLAQPLGHHPRQLRAAPELGRLGPPRPPPGLVVGELGPVTAAAPAAADLAPDRRVRAAQRTADPAIRIAARDPTRDLLALGRGQTAARAPPRPPRPDPAAIAQVTADLAP
jgi:hypothetical protein